MSGDRLAVRGLRRRFTLALLASVVIHLVVLVALSVVEIEHIERSESQPLTARIAPLAPLAAPEVKPAPAPPKPRPKARAKPKPTPEASTAALPRPLPLEPVAPTATPAAVPAETTAAAAEAPARAETAQPEPAASGPAAAPPAGPPIAFPERIELEFDLAKSADEGTIGRVVHRFEREGARYMIQSVSAAVGIASLFATGRYVQESRGTLTPQGLQPEQFVVRRGRTERTESAAFDWASSRATLSAGGATKEWKLQAGAQDQLSYLHQLSFLIADPSLPTVTVTNGRRFYNASIEILGWETVATGLGPIKALQVRSQLEGESRIDFWLAPEYGNLPVKLRVRNQRGEQFEQVLMAMKVVN